MLKKEKKRSILIRPLIILIDLLQDSGETEDYTITGNVLTFVESPH